jgi:integrase
LFEDPILPQRRKGKSLHISVAQLGKLIRITTSLECESEMPGKQAKILSPDQIEDLLFFANTTRNPDRNRVIVLLSIKAGLRAAEISKLTWDMVLDPCGDVTSSLELRDNAAKMGSGRIIPLHPDLRQALSTLRQSSSVEGSVIRSTRSGPMIPISIVIWFARAYETLGLDGCSSHSGRRTFITRAARVVHKAGGSLRDVQLLAGHRSIQTTQRYIDGDSDAQRRLISLI